MKVNKAKAELYKKLDGLPHSNAGQTMHIGTDHIYIEQNYKSKNQILNRLSIGDGLVATYKDHEIFNNCGHNQLLEYIRDGYFIKFVKPIESTKTKYWATELALIKYEPGKTIESYEDVKRFKELCNNCYRCEGALSSDKKTVMVLAKNTSNKGSLHYLDTEKLISALEASEINEISVPAGSYVKPKQYLTASEIIAMSPYKSNQGMELSNDFRIYQSGGSVGGKLGINYCDYKGKVLAKAIIEHPDFHTGEQEIEAIQAKGDYIYILVSNKALKTYKQRIYRVKKSAIRGA